MVMGGGLLLLLGKADVVEISLEMCTICHAELLKGGDV